MNKIISLIRTVMKKQLVCAGYHVHFGKPINPVTTDPLVPGLYHRALEPRALEPQALNPQAFNQALNPLVPNENIVVPNENIVVPSIFDSFLESLDPHHHITSDIIKLIKRAPCFVATKHIRQGCGQNELTIWQNKNAAYEAVLRGIKIESTKKQLQYILGEISINGEKLHIVMYNNTTQAPFSIKMNSLNSKFVPLPQTMKFKCVPHCL